MILAETLLNLFAAARHFRDFLPYDLHVNFAFPYPAFRLESPS
jgi:hypothetical protein